jgi:hypothetical protein
MLTAVTLKKIRLEITLTKESASQFQTTSKTHPKLTIEALVKEPKLI